MYQGVYHGSKKHAPDLEKVLSRSWNNGMDKMIITGGSVADSKKAIDLSRTDCKLLLSNLRLEVCPESLRNYEDLIELMKKYVREGSTIHTDFWKAYDCLSELGFIHKK